MEVEEKVLRLMANVINRAWYRCKSGTPNSELLLLLSRALSDTALEHQSDREAQEARDRDLADTQARHDAEEREIRGRMPAS